MHARMTNLLWAVFALLLLSGGTTLAQEKAWWETLPPKMKKQKNMIRSRQFYEPRMYPSKQLPIEDYRAEMAREKNNHMPNPSPEAVTWTSIGPDEIHQTGIVTHWQTTSGRVRAIAVDRWFGARQHSAYTAYIGAAAGGIWKTNNLAAGDPWFPVGDDLASLTFGAIAIDPGRTDTVYAGSGEARFGFNTTTYNGNGLYRSFDGGSSWTQIINGFGANTHFADIAVSNENRSIIFAALASGYTYNGSLNNEGIWRSSDYGSTWTRVINQPDAFDIEPFPNGSDPDRGQWVFAAIGGETANSSGLYRSTDNGLNWTRITSGLPQSQEISRMQIAIAPTTPAIMYAAIYTSGFGTRAYRSADFGSTWAQISTGTELGGFNGQEWRDQGNYDLCIDVSHFDPDRVMIGNIELHQATDGLDFDPVRLLPGINMWQSPMHLDYHNIIFGIFNGQAFYTNDGGVYYELDFGGIPVYHSRNEGLSTIQFYRLSSSPFNPNHMLGGAQDNGVFYSRDAGNTWTLASTGDGMECFFDYADVDIAYASTQEGNLLRSSNGGLNFDPIMNGLPEEDAQPRAWTAPFFMDATSHVTLYTATDRPFVSVDQGDQWGPINTTGLDSILGLRAIDQFAQSQPAPQNFAIASGPHLYVSTDGASTWTDRDNGLPNRFITRLVWDHSSGTTLYAVVSGFGNTGNIFRSTDLGQNWTNLSGNLPQVPHNDLLLHPDIPGVMYAANDFGVYETSDDGVTWVRQGGRWTSDMPFVPVIDLHYQESAQLLRAATHGRSAYQTQLAPTLPATYTWNVVSGDWHDPANWDPFGLPGKLDHVSINSGTVTLDSTIEISGLAITGNATLNGSDTLTILSVFNWNGGQMSGSGVTVVDSNAIFTLASVSQKTLNRTVINRGTGIWSGGNIGTLNNQNANFINDGTFDIRIDKSFGFDDGIFLNNGVIINNSPGTTLMSMASFINEGSVILNAGVWRSVNQSSGTGGYHVSGGATLSINSSSHTMNGSPISGSGLIDFSGGVLQVDSLGLIIPSSIELVISGNARLEGSGPVTINSSFDWRGGSMESGGDVTVTPESNFTLSTTAQKTLNRRLVNQASAVWSDGNIGTSNNRNNVFVNEGTLEILADATFGFDDGTFQNLGIIEKNSPGTMLMGMASFVNAGNVVINSGVWRSVNQSSGSGGYHIGGGATLWIASSIHTMGGNQLAGSGLISISAGVLEIDSVGLVIPEAISLSMSGGTLSGEGQLTINGDFDWQTGHLDSGGDVTVNPQSNFTLSTAAQKTLDRRLINRTTAVWSGGNVGTTPNRNNNFINDGVLVVQTDNFFGFGDGTFQNNGTIEKDSPGTIQMWMFNFINDGTLNINSGVWRSVNGTDGSGSYQIAAGASMLINGATHVYNGNTIAGGGQIDFSGGVLQIDSLGLVIPQALSMTMSGGTLDGDGPLTIHGDFDWQTGHMDSGGDVTVTASSNFTLSGPSQKTLDRTLINQATAVWSDGNIGTNGFRNNVFVNEGTLDIQADLRWGFDDGNFFNLGTIEKNSPGTSTISMETLDNDGLIDVRSGTLRIWNSVTNDTLGIVRGSGILEKTNPVIINHGRFQPGSSPGVLSFTGNYPMLASAALDIEIGGYLQGSEYDRLAVSGTATLDGALNLSFINGFSPVEGDTFRVLTYASHSGQFAAITPPAGISVQVDYQATGLLLTVGPVQNQAPSAQNDVLTTDEDLEAFINVLANDSDPNGDPLYIEAFSQGQHGAVAMAGDSSLSYTPQEDFFGSDSFSYSVTDSISGSDQAMVLVTVSSVNDPPEISTLPPLSYSEDDTLRYPVANFLAVIDDPDDPDSLLGLSIASTGNITVQTDGADFLFLSPPNWFGADTLLLIASDGSLSDSADLAIMVLPVNDAPQFINLPDSLILEPAQNTFFDVWASVVDIETADSLLTFQFAVSNDSIEANYDNSAGQLRLTPAAGYLGQATLELVAIDPESASGTDSMLLVVSTMTGIEHPAEAGIPVSYVLEQNYPNPFNPSTTIRFGLPHGSAVTLEIFNIVGQRVITILAGDVFPAGWHEVEWDGRSAAGVSATSGVYFYRLTNDDGFLQTRKMLLVR